MPNSYSSAGFPTKHARSEQGLFLMGFWNLLCHGASPTIENKDRRFQTAAPKTTTAGDQRSSPQTCWLEVGETTIHWIQPEEKDKPKNRYCEAKGGDAN